MGNLTQPRINISFETRAASAIQRSQKGTVLMILRDTVLGGKHYVLTNVTEIPDTLSAENQAAIARCFKGYVNPPRAVLLTVIDDTANTLALALAWAATQSFDYLVAPLDAAAAECETIASWVKSQRLNNYAIYKAVLPNHDADAECVVNFAGDNIVVSGTSYDTAEYCSRIAGILAGTPMRIAATYANLPEVESADRLTKTEQDAAVGAGKLIIWFDGSKFKLGRAVNSLSTTTDRKGDAFKKIKIVECLDMIQNDIRTTIQDDYIGKYANNYDNKLILVTAIRGYFMQLEREGLIDEGWDVGIDVDAQQTWLTSQGTDCTKMTAQEIKEANTGSYVFIYANIKPLDAIEDVTLAVRI